MLEQYKAQLETKQTELKRIKEQKFQERAIKERYMLISRLQNTFPIFYDLYEEDIMEAPEAWFNCDPKPVGSKYGMPGIVLWGHVFIGLRRDSDQFRIYLGSWPNQDAYTNSFQVEKGFPCQPFVEIGLMNEYRVELEQNFFKSVESCISLITAGGNASSFPNWRLEKSETS